MGRAAAFNVAVSFTVVAFILELLGLFTPLWFITDINVLSTVRIYTGLWFVTIDGSSSPYSNVLLARQVRWILLISWILTFIVAMGLLIYVCQRRHSRTAYTWFAYILLVSGVMHVIGIIMWLSETIYPALDGNTFPWGVLMSSVGALLTIGAFIALCLVLYKDWSFDSEWEHHRSRSEHHSTRDDYRLPKYDRYDREPVDREPVFNVRESRKGYAYDYKRPQPQNAYELRPTYYKERVYRPYKYGW